MSSLKDPKAKNVWIDGCFDILHYGHINLIKNASLCGENVIVGIHSDRDVSIQKRTPVFQMLERKTMLESIRGVSKVVLDAPYVTSLEWLDRYNCDLCVHGDDDVICANGTDPYEQVKIAQRYKQLSRTETVSSSQIITRYLGREKLEIPFSESHRLSIYRRYQEYVDEPFKQPESGQRVIYVGGRFDLLHPCLINYFKKLKNEENYLIVGVLGDDTIGERSGKLPVLCTYERGLAIKACKYVDHVVFDAPSVLIQDFIDHYDIDLVFYGDMDYNYGFRTSNYKHIHDKKIFRSLPPRELKLEFVEDRIRERRLHYKSRLGLDT